MIKQTEIKTPDGPRKVHLSGGEALKYIGGYVGQQGSFYPQVMADTRREAGRLLDKKASDNHLGEKVVILGSLGFAQ